MDEPKALPRSGSDAGRVVNVPLPRAPSSGDSTRPRSQSETARLWRQELRGQKELSHARTTSWASVVVALATSIGALAASYAAWQAGEAVGTAQSALERGTQEARFASAVESIGGERPAQRVAGFVMLRRNVEDRLNVASDRSSKEEAVRLYGATLDIFENYLKSPDPDTGRDDRVYAAGHVSGMLRSTVARQRVLESGIEIGTDLSNVRLYGQSWPRIDASWLTGGKNMPGIDLRASNLRESRWGSATMTSAKLRCANLELAVFYDDRPDYVPPPGRDLRGALLNKADLRNANLAYADLREVDLTGAQLTGANVEGARLDGALVDTNQQVLGRDASGRFTNVRPAEQFDKDACIATNNLKP